MKFPLSQTRELFFDSQLWGLFVSYFATPKIAFERIGYPPDLTGYHTELFPLRSQLSRQQWREIEEARALGEEILRSLRAKFLNEEITATGIPRGRSRLKRESIPAQEWWTLWPNFVGNWAMSTVGSYDNIELIWHPQDPSKAELVEQLDRLLLDARSDGESRRKVLLEAVRKHFGQQVSIREFNEAYRRIFQKRRGRPPSAK
jgi:hypothetical protein